MTAEQQQKMDALYALDNVLTIDIEMPSATWDALRTEAPAGGVCNFNYKDGGRYTWRTATKVTISGTAFPAKTTFTDVGVKKKSFCGSIRSDKPSLHIDFAKVKKENKPIIEALIGTRYITLNNSVQDQSYVRQTLGYRMYEQAGLPFSRSNFARVRVNGVPIGQGFPDQRFIAPPGLYVNVEPVMPRYVERNFTHRKGNLYEIEHTDDFTDARFDFIGVEDLSAFDDKKDLRLAIDRLNAHGINGALEVFDVDKFIKLYTMDFFLKHWDGYSRNTNNTYVYNDLDAVANPAPANVRFTLIPWGLDQILQPTRHFVIGSDGRLARMVTGTPAQQITFYEQVRAFRETIFSRDAQQSTWIPLLDSMQNTLTPFGVPNVAAEIGIVRKQLRLAMSAGYLAGGLAHSPGLYIRDDATNDVMHAGTETIPPADPAAVNFETTHRPRLATIDDTDLWTIGSLGTGISVHNKATGRALHASQGVQTSQGLKMLYTCPDDNTGNADEFDYALIDSPDQSTFSGYFELVSRRTGLKAKFGSSPTPNGHPRVHQDASGSKLFFS